MARLARKQMADMRALEEEAERMNPISGAGATPSMGLSQFRGGRSKKMSKIAKMEAMSPSIHNEEEDEMAEMPSGEYGNAGMAGGAKAQGEHLMKHLHKLHGGEFAKNFHAGMSMAMKGGINTGRYEGEGEMRGGFWGALASLAAPLIGSLFGKGKMTKEAHDELMALCKRGAGTGAGDEMRGGFWGALASLAVPLIGKLFGKGQMTKDAHDELVACFSQKEKKGKMKGGSRMVGAGPFSPMALKMILPRKEAGIVEGGADITHDEMMALESVAKKHKKPKRVVGAGDGRRKRADIVKKVMADKGMSMIEASKYVKEHGLYK
jgi:hypothetical protein